MRDILFVILLFFLILRRLHNPNPMYLLMYRKPENRADIQNVACGRAGIMMWIRIVKSVKNEEEQQYDE